MYPIYTCVNIHTRTLTQTLRHTHTHKRNTCTSHAHVHRHMTHTHIFAYTYASIQAYTRAQSTRVRVHTASRYLHIYIHACIQLTTYQHAKKKNCSQHHTITSTCHHDAIFHLSNHVWTLPADSALTLAKILRSSSSRSPSSDMTAPFLQDNSENGIDQQVSQCLRFSWRVRFLIFFRRNLAEKSK